MKILLATRNPGKVREIREILRGLPLEIRSLEGLEGVPEVEEDGATFLENALKKARVLAHWAGDWTLADDSGLEVEALNGEPGVHSARYAGEGASDEQNNAKLLDALRGLPMEARKARFRCVMALVSPQGEEWVVEGTCEGYVAEAPRGQGGFGYDPLFYVPELGRTFAELSPEVKNRISHRAQALARLRVVLEGLLKMR